MDPLTAINTRRTPQSQQASPKQQKNAAGGYTFTIGDEARIHRFLTLGTTGGTYYTGEQELTKDNAAVVLGAARDRGEWLVERVTEVSVAGRAPKQNPAIFALAAAAGLADDNGRKAALAALPAVCRTGTHLFLFARYVEQFRGWGRGLRTAVGNWYLDREVDQLAYQAAKYRQREGLTHRDVLRLASPVTDEPARRALFNWIVSGDVATSRAPGGEKTASGWVHSERSVGATADDLPALTGLFETAQAATEVHTWVECIERGLGLSWEMLPDAALGHKEVWRALIEQGLPQTALMRQLPRLTRLGVLEGDTRAAVVAQLQDGERLRKGRVHPVNILIAARTYAGGRSMRGESTWSPDRRIIDALDAAFYAAYAAVEPAGKRTLVALDVSGSMGSPAGGLPISCREAAAALSLVTLSTEPNADVVGFTSGASSRGGWGRWRSESTISELTISPRQRLDDVCRYTAGLDFGGTDCALPMTWALEQGRSYDTFAIFTDNETWAGNIHPHQALERYRQKTGIDARVVVVGMTSTNFSIANPDDPGMLDIAGFDSAVPNLIADFSRGTI